MAKKPKKRELSPEEKLVREFLREKGVKLKGGRVVEDADQPYDSPDAQQEYLAQQDAELAKAAAEALPDEPTEEQKEIEGVRQELATSGGKGAGQKEFHDFKTIIKAPTREPKAPETPAQIRLREIRKARYGGGDNVTIHGRGTPEAALAHIKRAIIDGFRNELLDAVGKAVLRQFYNAFVKRSNLEADQFGIKWTERGEVYIDWLVDETGMAREKAAGQIGVFTGRLARSLNPDDSEGSDDRIFDRDSSGVTVGTRVEYAERFAQGGIGKIGNRNVDVVRRPIFPVGQELTQEFWDAVWAEVIPELRKLIAKAVQ